MKSVIASILISIFAFAGAAHADYAKTYNFAKEFQVKDGETQALQLYGIYYVKSLVIQAEGIGQDSTIEVVVNGETKGTIYAPGADPSYVVTVADNADSIEFRHRSGGAMRVRNVKVVLSGAEGEDQLANLRSVDGLSNSIIKLADLLIPYASIQEQNDYLIPLKIKAANVNVMNTAHGELSITTRRALRELQNQIQTSDVYITTLLEQEAFFEMGIQFLTVKETIKDLLD